VDERCHHAAPGAPLADPFLRLPTHLAFEIVRRARRMTTEMFPDEELRRPHVITMVWLAEHGPMSQREVSEQLRVDPADMVGVIDVLERLGHVERRRDPSDRRRYSLHLTETGRKALQDRRGQGERLDEELFAPLDSGEREALQALLLKVLAHHDPRFAASDVTEPPGRQ
jgi:DNA-binding MarR family transcriptional regulator